MTFDPKGRNVAIFNIVDFLPSRMMVSRLLGTLPCLVRLKYGRTAVKEAATRTNGIVGDGTTTATVLAHAMFHKGMKNLAPGMNAMLMKKGIMAALTAVSDHILEQSSAVNTREAIAQVTSVSAQDTEIGVGVMWRRNSAIALDLSRWWA